MNLKSIIRAWVAWRWHQRLRRSIKGYREIDDMVREARRRHQPVADLQQKQRELLHRELRRSA